MGKLDDHAAHLVHLNHLCSTLEELQAETFRLSDEITARHQRSRARDRLLKPTRRAPRRKRRS
jgi:hypothetical protein